MWLWSYTVEPFQSSHLNFCKMGFLILMKYNLACFFLLRTVPLLMYLNCWILKVTYMFSCAIFCKFYSFVLYRITIYLDIASGKNKDQCLHYILYGDVSSSENAVFSHYVIIALFSGIHSLSWGWLLCENFLGACSVVFVFAFWLSNIFSHHCLDWYSFMAKFNPVV